MTKVAVLGCGPSGLIAAHAAFTQGAEVHIYSKKVRSQMFGAMYLHHPIPGVTPTEPFEIQVVKLGTREGYATNVYGDPEAPVSWDKFQDGPTQGWSLTGTYDRLWYLYGNLIKNREVNRPILERIIDEYDYVFSTIPAPAICRSRRHDFKALPIWVMHGTEDRSRRSPFNVMYYNGLKVDGSFDPWYRYSIIRGYQSWEYSPYTVPSYIQRGAPSGSLQVSRGQKPLSTNCDCWPEIIRLGRFGKWDKHAFTHHSYDEVRDVLQ